MKLAVELFAMAIEPAMPFAIVFALGQRMINMYLGAAFKGDLRI